MTTTTMEIKIISPLNKGYLRIKSESWYKNIRMEISEYIVNTPLKVGA